MANNFYDILRDLRVTGQFGEPRPGHTHQGIDLAMPLGTPIRSSVGGTVKGIYNDPKGYGNYIDITSPDDIVTRYAHAQGFDVKPGSEILPGQILGKSGATGRATGPHLHYEVRKGNKSINPMELQNIMANLNQPQDLAQLKNVLVQKELGNVPQQEPDEKTQLYNELVKQELQTLMGNKVQQPARLGDVIPAFQTGAASGLDKLGEYLGTSQGQDVMGALFGALGNKDMATAQAIGANRKYKEEMIDKQNQADLFRQNQGDMADITRGILVSQNPKGGSSFKDMADYYFSQGLIDEDKYKSLQSTDLYSQDITLPPSVMGKSLQPFLNKQGHGYRMDEIGASGGQQRQTKQFEEGLPSKVAETQSKVAETGKKFMLPPEKVSEISDIKNSINVLNKFNTDLDKIQDKGFFTPIIGGAYTGLRSATGSPSAKAYQSSITDVWQTIGKAKEGGVLRAEDTKKYQKILFEPGHTKEQIRATIKEINNKLNGKLQQNMKDYEAAGYNLKGLGEVQSKYKVTVVK